MIKPRPAAQQKHVDALSRAPLPLQPDQKPIELDVFPDRVVLHVASWKGVTVAPGIIRFETTTQFPGTMFHVFAARAARQRRARTRKVPRLSLPEDGDGSPLPSDPEDSCEVFLSEDEGEGSGEKSLEVAGVPQPPPELLRSCQDCVSSQPVPLEGGDVPSAPLRSIALPAQFHYNDLRAAQLQDEDCTLFRSFLHLPAQEWPAPWKQSALRFLLKADVLCVILPEKFRALSSDEEPIEKDGKQQEVSTPRPRIVLPAVCRERAIYSHHLSYYGGHFGYAKTLARLSVRYWWPAMGRDVRAYLAKCAYCLAHAPFKRTWKWLSVPIGTPFEVVAADLFGPLRPTTRGHTHILVLIDHHTRWVELVPLPEPTAALVAEAIFEVWISRWGVMRALLTDNGRQFTSKLVRQLSDVYGIKRIFSSPYHPRGNSIVESYMRSLKSTLRLCVDTFKTEWDYALQAAALAYRATPHTVIGYSPYFLVTGQEVVLPLSREWNEPVLSLTGATWLEALWKCRQTVVRDHRLAAEANARAVQQQGTGLVEGAIVALRRTADERKAEGKMSSLFTGPYEIVKVLSSGVTAEIRCAETGTIHTVNRARLKLLQAPPKYFPETPELPKPRLR